MIENIILQTNPDGTKDLILKNLSCEDINEILNETYLDKAGNFVWPSNRELIISTKDKRKEDRVFY